MLKNANEYTAYHLQAAINSFNFLYNRPLSTLITVVVIAIALTLPALFWVFTDNMEHLTLDLQRGSHISLYLKTPITEPDVLVNQIRTMDGVDKVIFKTQADSLAELQKQEGMQDIMRYLPENPLPAVIEVVPVSSVNTPIKIKQLFERLSRLPQVDQAKLDMEWIIRMHAFLSFLAKLAEGFMALLALAVVLIVANTLRLAISNRYEEIQVLKLIGADDAFITRPFLYSGVWYGLAGAIFAILFVNIFMFTAMAAFQHLAALYQIHYPLSGLTVKQAYFIVFISIFLGWIGARLSVKRQLASIEPYN